MSEKTKQTPPILSYLFKGEDEFRKTLSLNKLKEKVLGKSPDSLRYQNYYAKDTNLQEVIQSLETFSFTGERKLIVLKEIEHFCEDDKKALINYLKSQREKSNIFVLTIGKSSQKSSKLALQIEKYTNTYEFSSLEPNELSSWIINQFKKRNKSIKRPLAELIAESVEGDLKRANFLIEAVSLYAADRDMIEESDLAHFLSVPVEKSTFKLLDSINQKDAGESLKILKGLLKTESSPSQIIGLLSWHIARLIVIKRLIIKKVSKKDMFSYVKVGTYMLNRLINQAGEFTIKQLKNNLQLLMDTDLLIKRSSLKDEFLLEMVIVQLTS